MKYLYYFAAIKEIFNPLAKYYFRKSFNFNFLNDIDKRKIKLLLLIDKFKIYKISFTISPIWKHYLAIHSPNTKLIIMGFCNFQSPNYIDLLNLPKNFEEFVENALPVSEDWEIPIDGADLQMYLKRFFEGHGGKSFLSKK